MEPIVEMIVLGGPDGEEKMVESRGGYGVCVIRRADGVCGGGVENRKWGPDEGEGLRGEWAWPWPAWLWACMCAWGCGCEWETVRGSLAPPPGRPPVWEWKSP